ncbi:MAG: hypothetical protein A3F89_01625 [Deltaproteobacteria bacterium RIFCSPLOWO2_12_FULL_50_11]|nr:MAG: hypothetical protein A2053_02400 [Deltaproteobacteria bacterium GWA2_50_8]OGQ66065.1 MAG: hypothetical protein A3F89_01625 [Deltaproteobacteria bacterium RIFCSPLOWO2_12_FULL_50_11]
MQQKKHLDQLLVERGLTPSLSKAQALILAGGVWVKGQKIEKPGHLFSPDVAIELKGKSTPFVSRGGEKLDHALKTFALNVEGWRFLDIGASTGGFTDCLLKSGALSVVAVDVGYGQLAWSLRQDPRVRLFEKTNIRHFSPKSLEKGTVDGITIDVSFISLKKVIPLLPPFLKPQGTVLALVKPQFEVTREEVGKKGVVKDPRLHERVLLEIRHCLEKEGFQIQKEAPSPLLGPEGNKEFFLWATLTPRPS